MSTATTIDPRYPIGRFSFDVVVTPADRSCMIDEIAALPGQFRALLAGRSTADMERTYRQGGWTVRQVVHHVPDSHLNGYTRFKLALTEDSPTIKPYDEAKWAELADSATVPVEVSLAMLEAIHRRWVAILHAMRPEDFARSYVHPEHGRALSLDVGVANYAWHGRHHLEHVRLALR